MSIASEITRLQGVKSDILQAIADKGVTVPSDSMLDDCPDLIASIGGGFGSVVIGGRSYKTIVMPDGKEWLAENLDYKWTGLDIGPAGTPSTQAAWYYNNDEATYGIDGTYKCGLLYNWYAVEYLETNKSILLPDGWHVASKSEWENLASTIPVGATTAALQLKSIDLSVSPTFPNNWNGIDAYGFSEIPCGARYSDFTDIGTYALIWTATKIDSSNAHGKALGASDNSILSSYYTDKTGAYSIRLVKGT